jgi:hypothetical protein
VTGGLASPPGVHCTPDASLSNGTDNGRSRRLTSAMCVAAAELPSSPLQCPSLGRSEVPESHEMGAWEFSPASVVVLVFVQRTDGCRRTRAHSTCCSDICGCPCTGARTVGRRMGVKRCCRLPGMAAGGGWSRQPSAARPTSGQAWRGGRPTRGRCIGQTALGCDDPNGLGNRRAPCRVPGNG